MVPDAEVMPCPQMLTVTVAAVALQVRVYVPPEGPSFQLPPEVGPLVMVTPLTPTPMYVDLAVLRNVEERRRIGDGFKDVERRTAVDVQKAMPIHVEKA